MLEASIENNDGACDQFVKESRSGNIYQLSGIRRVISSTFGHDSFCLSVRDGSEITGVLPLVHMRSRLFGNFLVSMPFFNYGGVCTESENSRQALLEGAIVEAKRRHVDHIELRHGEQQFETLQSKNHKVAMILELPKTSEELWKAFKSKLRSQIRKPEKEGIIVKYGKKELLDHFYHVFSINMRDLGTPVYSKKLFQNMLQHYQDNAWIVVAFKDDIPVAAGFLVGFNDKMEIPWASSLRSYNRMAPNMLMYWESLKLAIEQGYNSFDFGRSSPDEGTYKFKQQWGAIARNMCWEYWLTDEGQLPDFSPKNNKYQSAIQVWQKLPLSVTRILGPAIVKNIP